MPRNGKAEVYRFRVTFTIGPTDRPAVDIFRWIMQVVVRAHWEAPAQIRVLVERVSEDDAD